MKWRKHSQKKQQFVETNLKVYVQKELEQLLQKEYGVQIGPL